MRKQIGSGSAWEEIVGYSRAVKVGNLIEVAGTTSSDGHSITGKNVYEQSIAIFKKIGSALKEMGSGLPDVVRTRMFITDISKWEEAGKAHGEVFKEIRPVTTLVEVSNLIDPGILIEIEATAIIDNSESC